MNSSSDFFKLVLIFVFILKMRELRQREELVICLCR